MAVLGSLRRLRVARLGWMAGGWEPLFSLTTLRTLELDNCK